MARAAGWLAAFVVALVAVAGLILFFNSRDDSKLEAAPRGPGTEYRDLGNEHLPASARGTGRYDSDPPTSGPHVPDPVRRDGVELSDDEIVHALELGNVILFYGQRSAPASLRALQADTTGRFDPVLVEAGQTVILARRPGTPGVVAAAWRRLLGVPTAEDPRLAAFVDANLGRGAP